MKLSFAVILTALTVAAASDYKVTILKQESVVQPELMTSRNFVGKSIAEIFGPISEVRAELVMGGLANSGEEKIRQRIDHAKCLGRDSDIPWHKVP
jgi:hypothetical protein